MAPRSAVLAVVISMIQKRPSFHDDFQPYPSKTPAREKMQLLLMPG